MQAATGAVPTANLLHVGFIEHYAFAAPTSPPSGGVQIGSPLLSWRPMLVVRGDVMSRIKTIYIVLALMMGASHANGVSSNAFCTEYARKYPKTITGPWNGVILPITTYGGVVVDGPPVRPEGFSLRSSWSQSYASIDDALKYVYRIADSNLNSPSLLFKASDVEFYRPTNAIYQIVANLPYDTVTNIWRIDKSLTLYFCVYDVKLRR